MDALKVCRRKVRGEHQGCVNWKDGTNVLSFKMSHSFFKDSDFEEKNSGLKDMMLLKVGQIEDNNWD